MGPSSLEEEESCTHPGYVTMTLVSMVLGTQPFPSPRKRDKVTGAETQAPKPPAWPGPLLPSACEVPSLSLSEDRAGRKDNSRFKVKRVTRKDSV